MALLHRKPVRALLIIVGVIALAALAVTIFLPAEKIRDLALAQAREKLGREVTVGDVSVSLRGGLGVRLADFVIRNPDGFGGDPLLATRGVDLKLAIRPLLGGEVRVHRLVLDGPTLNLVRRADGSDNFTFPATGDDPAAAAGTTAGGADAADAPPPLSIASLTVQDGRVAFSDEGAPTGSLRAVRVEGLALGLSLSDPVPQSYRVEGRATADKIVVDGPGELPDLDAAVDFDVTWDNEAGDLKIAQAAAEILGLPLAATGQLAVSEGTATGAIELQTSGQSLVGLKPFLPADLAARLAGDDKSGTFDATIDLTLTGDKAVPVHTHGRVDVRDMDLALAQPFLPPQQKGNLAGRGNLVVVFADTTGNPDLLDYHGTAQATNVSFTESGLVDDLQQMDARLAFTPDQVTVQECRAEFASGTLELTGDLRDPFPYFLPPELQEGKTMKTPQLNFVLHAAKLDVDRLLPPASPTGAAQGGQPGITRKPAIPAGLEFPDILCDGTFSADSVFYMQVPLTGVKGKVNVRDRQLSVHEVTGAVYQGTVGGHIDVDLKNLQDPAYTGSYAARNIEVNKFMTRFAGLSGVVFGGCNLTGDFKTRGLDPQAILNGLTLEANALVEEGRVVTKGRVHDALSGLAATAGGSFDQEQTLRDLATHVKVADGRVGVSELTTRLGQFADVTVDGSYAFTGGLDYRGTLLLTESQTTQIFSQGPMAELAQLLGSRQPQRLRLPITVGGTRTDPKVKIELDTVVDELQKAVVKEQGQKLEDEAKTKLGDLLNKWKK